VRETLHWPPKKWKPSLCDFPAGLPDGLFLNQKNQFGHFFEGLGMENVYIFYYHLDYFTAIWYNLWQCDIVCGHLVYFSHFGIFGPGKIWQPCFPESKRAQKMCHENLRKKKSKVFSCTIEAQSSLRFNLTPFLSCSRAHQPCTYLGFACFNCYL
jgi:hypothetical protein